LIEAGSVLDGCDQIKLIRLLFESTKRTPLSILKQCIELGLDVNLLDGNACNALHVAALFARIDNFDPELFKTLIKAGCDVNAKTL